MSLRQLSAVVGVFALFFCANGWAQVSTGTISGSVVDASGSAISGAKVKIVNVDTGLTREVVSGDGGRYVAPQLPVGNYSVEASQTGFQTELRKGIELTVGGQLVLNLQLTVGSINQQVEVTGEATQIETTNATVDYLVDEKKIADLPLNGRNYTQLATLQPGVSGFNMDRRDGVTGNGSGMSLSGTQTRQNLFLMDGQDMNDSSGGTPGSAAGTNLGVDAIREFTVTTTNYNAEYGIQLGGVFNVVTRSGSNQLRGSVFEYIRNSALDAKNFFDNPRLRIPEFRRNQFGGTLAGPIKKDRTFFMGTYEGFRQSLGNTLLNFVPNVAAHAGCVPNNASAIIDSQCINFTAPSGKGLTYVGVSPVIASRLGVIPLPNGPDKPDGTGQLTTSSNAAYREDYVLARLDHQISQNNSIFGRYIFDNSSAQAIQGVPIFGAENTTRYQFGTLNWTSVITPNLVNQARASINRSAAFAEGINLTGLTTAQLSWTTGSNPTFVGTQAGTWSILSPQASFGATTPGEQGGSFNETPRHWTQTMYEFADSAIYTHGKHSIRTGVLFQRYLFNPEMNNRVNPAFASVSAFLQAQVASLSVKVDSVAYSWQNLLFGWYVQDDIKLSRTLTLNLGLRHEFTTTPVEKFGRSDNLVHLTDTALTLGPPYDPRKRNLEPRVGLAWDVFGNGKTAVRVGAGIFHEQDILTTLRIGFAGLYPFIKAYTFLNPPSPVVNTDNLPAAAATIIRWGGDGHPKLATKFQWSLNIQQQVDSNTSFSAAYVGWRGAHFLFRKEANPFGSEICPCPVDPGNPNATPPIPPDSSTALLPAGTIYHPIVHLPRLNTKWTTIGTDMEWGGDAYYNALQLNLIRRFAKGLQYQAAYTWSKTIDITSQSWLGAVSGQEASGIQNPFDYRAERAVSANDIPSFFTSNVTYDIPFGDKLTGVPSTLAKGWSLNLLTSFNSGLPFSITDGFSQSRDGQPGGPADRPNLTPGVPIFPASGVSAGCAATGGPAAGTPVRTPTLWFDPCAFTLQHAGTYGNAPRNAVRGPSQFNMDFSTSKEFNLSEHAHLQFRAEIFNILNHPNFAIIKTTTFTNSTGARNGSAGTIINTSTPSRQIQFGMRLSF
jgi:hypothetical protein